MDVAEGLRRPSLTLGPIVIGTVFNAFLYGICMLQFSSYWANTLSRDKSAIRLLVGWTFLLDTFHTSALLYMLWVYVVVNFSNPAFLKNTVWPFSVTPLITSMTSFPIQVYLAWRIKRFSSSLRVFVGLVFLAFAQATLGIICSVQALRIQSISHYQSLIPFVDAWQVLSISADGSITLFLAWYLTKSRTGQKRSDNVITRIIRSSIETAAVGAFFCMMDLITFTTLQDTNFHCIFAFPMGRIYTNTLLMILNSRTSLRAQFEQPILPDIMVEVSQPHVTTTHPSPVTGLIVTNDCNSSIALAMNIYNDCNTARSDDNSSNHPDTTDPALRSKQSRNQEIV